MPPARSSDKSSNRSSRRYRSASVPRGSCACSQMRRATEMRSTSSSVQARDLPRPRPGQPPSPTSPRDAAEWFEAVRHPASTVANQGVRGRGRGIHASRRQRGCELGIHLAPSDRVSPRAIGLSASVRALDTGLYRAPRLLRPACGLPLGRSWRHHREPNFAAAVVPRTLTAEVLQIAKTAMCNYETGRSGVAPRPAETL
jgi:hypothetical protein